MNDYVEFKSRDVTLRGQLHGSNVLGEKKPTVIVATGDGKSGSKSNTYKIIIPQLLAKGVNVFTFDFEGKGYSDGDDRLLTIKSGLEDLTSAMNVLLRQGEVDPSRIGLLGSSFGGIVALNYVSRNPGVIKTIALKSPVSFLPEVYELDLGSIENLHKWKNDGYSELVGRYFDSYLEGFEFNTFAAAKSIHIPVLITHGTIDVNVPIIQSIRLKMCLAGEVELEIFEGVSHDYTENNALEKAANLYTNWFFNKL